MSLSKYPKRLDLFQVKKNAQFDGDPNGDFVMADDVNQLQDAVSAIEKALGIEPQGNKTSVGERISLLEGSSSLRVPSFLIYLGKPALINDSETYLEAAGHFAKYDHVVLGQSAQDPTDPDYAVTLQIIETVRASKDVKFYGYVDCGVNTVNLSVAELQIAIGQWKDIDASGVYCANFGFESRVSRDRQNEILDSIHQYDMVAILDAASPKEVFSDLFHETMNPNWIKPRTQKGDVYHLNKYCLDTSRTTAVFEPNVMGEIMKLIALYEYRVNDGIRIFGTPVIQTDIDKETAQRYYDYAHASALVTSLDAFHPVTEGYSAATNVAPTYDWVPIAGSWYMDSPRVEYDDQGILCIRETPFGRIILNTQEHTYRYEGIYIPYSLLQIAANTIEGTLLKDASIEDIKIKDYQGGRLIDAINAELDEAKRIDIAKIMKMDYSNLEGNIPVDVLKANVIQAINANIGFATIQGAVIGDLTAGHITSGTIDAGRITASVVDALNLYAQNMEVGSAVIGEAVIGDLSAEKITAGNIAAERLQAGVVDAINLSAKQGDIENLNADNITAGNIKAERLQAEVVNAMNLYATNMVADSARINAAVIGKLTAGHIEASVIDAIEANIGKATIDSAVIGQLTADHMKAQVVDAIQLYVGEAKIDQGHIGDLSADKITAGDIDADRLKAAVISAINLNAQLATIDAAVIGQLSASHITSGDLQAERLAASVVAAIDLYAQTMTAESASINTAAIGKLEVSNMQAAVISAVNASLESAKIEAAHIGTLEAENIKAAVIDAINANIGTAVIGEAKIGGLSAAKITSGDIDAERLKASVIDAINITATHMKIDAGHIGVLTSEHIEAAVIQALEANIGTATIDNALIGSLSADHIKGVVLQAIDLSVETAKIDAAKIGALTAEHISAQVLRAIDISTETATIDSAKIGALTADHIKGVVLQAIDLSAETATIDAAKIRDISADMINTGNLDTNVMWANVLEAINLDAQTAKIGAARIDTLTADHIKTAVIDAIEANIGIATINSAAIGTLTAGHIQGAVMDAIEANIGLATISSALIGSLTADHIKGVVIKAIELTTENAVIDQAKIGALDAAKITTGDLSADRMKANAISAVNGNFNNATIDSAKIGVLSADKMSANIIAALEANIGSAVINEALIETLHASKINAGDIAAARMTAHAITAINADITNATIDAAQIGSLKAENIEAEVVKAINASIETAKIGAAKIGSLKAENIQAEVLKAINASIETAKISEAQIGNLSASKITAGDIAAERLRANVVSAINSEFQTAVINQAKIGVLDASKITTGSIDANRMTANIVTALNAYAQTMTAGSARIDSAVMGTLAVDHMQAKVIDAVNASLGSAVINNAKIGTLTSDHIKTAVIDAVNANLNTATIKQGVIEDLSAEKIVTGSLKAEVMTANAIAAINADLTTATIDAAQIGALTAEHIQTEIIEAINASIETATIDAANIGSLEVANMKAAAIEAINASLSTATIDAAKIGELEVDNLKVSVINAINASVENIKIQNGMIEALTADHIKAVVIDAVNGRIGSATIDAAKIGVLEAGNIKAGSINTNHIDTIGLNASVIKTGFLDAARIRADSITSVHIDSDSIETRHLKAGQIDGSVIKGDTIHGSKIIAGTLSASNLTAGSITSVEIAAKTIQTRNLAAGAVDASVLRAGTITAEHISTIGLDANLIEVFGNDGQVLIGDGFVKVDGLDVGVVQSDNLVGNGLFLTASSGFGNLRDNPTGEAILGNQSKVEGAHQIWRIDTTTGARLAIDTGGTKPADVVIDSNYEYLYVTLQGDDKVAQIQVSQGTQATRTGVTLNTGKGPGKALYTGDMLMDMKHFFVLNTDPKDVNVPDSLTIIDAPPTSINEDLYVHHMIPLGNTPYDLRLRTTMEETTLAPGAENPHPGHTMYTYITQAGQGDIAVLDMSHVNSMYWKVIRNIPLAAHMTDNYHGGLDGRFGLNVAVGGDASSQYSDAVTNEAHAHGHGGYGTSDGSIRSYEPHGLALSSDANHIYVADYANGHLLIVDTRGKAPYNPLTGSRTTGNLGSMPLPPSAQGASGGGTSTPLPPPEEPHVHSLAAEDDAVFSIQAGGHGGHEMSDSEPVHVPGSTGPIPQEAQTTQWVRYRIPIGDSPERVEVVGGKIFVTLEGSNAVAVLDEADVLAEINADYEYYGPRWNEFTDFRALPTWHVRRIEVGAKPTEMTVSPDAADLYVTVNGQNQVVRLNIETEAITYRYQTGPNPKGARISPDGMHLYVTNHGGSGNLSFVYPTGAYIGDAYLGLEGGIEYQGAEHWVPNRSDWVYDTEDAMKVQSASMIEFHINEPFLNEGGFARLASHGVDPQVTSIEQDIYNVTNQSNGNNIASVDAEQLKQDASLVRFWPKAEWLQEHGVRNITIFAKTDEFLARDAVDNRVFYPLKDWIDAPERPVILMGMAGDYVEVSENNYDITYGEGAKIVFHEAVPGDNEVYSSAYYYSEKADPLKYTVHYEGDVETSAVGTVYGDSHITFADNYLPQGAIIKAGYTYKHNRWFRSHNGSVLIATENSSSENFYVQFEVDEFVPKFITYDNQQTDDFTYWPIEVPAVTNADYLGMHYSGATNRALGAEVLASAAPVSGALNAIVDGLEPMTDMEEQSNEMHAMHAYGEVVELPAGSQHVVIDLGKTYMATDIHITHAFHKNRQYHGTKTEVSMDGIHWTTLYDSALEGEYLESEYDVGHGMTHYGKHLTVHPQRPVRYVRDWANGYTEWTTTSTDVATWTQDTLVGTFPENHWTEVKVFGDWEFEKEFARNYTSELLNLDPRNPQVSFLKGGITVTGGNKALNIGNDDAQDIVRIVDRDLLPQRYFTAGNGAATVTIDLGEVQQVDTLRIFRYFADFRIHEGVKTEISADGTTWTTVYDSAVDGEYEERASGKIIPLGSVQGVRYIRDRAASWKATLKTGTILTGTDIRWTGIHAYLGYDANYPYVYPMGAELEGQNLATNGQGVVTTEVSKAFAAIDLPIDFTSWWYMTYVVGPEFGQVDVEMPTVMGGSHSLFQDAPYLNKVAHRHIMSWPNSKNIKADAGQGIQAGMHRAIVRQKSGKVSIDRLRFEDYQYLYMNSTEIPRGNATNFMRYKIEPEVAKWYVGRGNQSTQGAYDHLNVNSDTGKPDGSVAIKYRFRIKTRLNPKGIREERGVAYVTSAIFETGRLSSHWRMSQTQDSFPGNRIQRWDPNQPHKTGIQSHHLANGSVRGSKLMPHTVMDHHISPYAGIEESKLNLKYPTHRHGQFKNLSAPDGSQFSVWMDNKAVLDSIEGFGGSGHHNQMARADHTHDHIANDLMIHGTLEVLASAMGEAKVWNTINGVDLVALKADFDAHVAAADVHYTVTERTKLAGISQGANKTTASATNGNILVDSVETVVYTHPTTAGNKHIPTGGAAGNFLKYSASGTAAWVSVAWGDVTGKPATFTPPIATASVLGGVKVGSGLSVTADGTVLWSHPTGDGNLHVPATGTANLNKVLKAGATAGSGAWGQVQFAELGGGLSEMQHGQLGGGSLHANATPTAAGFQSAADKAKLDAIDGNAINQASADSRYLQLTGGTVNGDLTVNGVLNMGTNASSTTTVTFDGETAAALQIQNANGYISLTSLNAGWAHIYTDRAKFIFNKPVYTTTNMFSSYDSDMLLQRLGTTKLTLGDTVSTFTTSVKASTFTNTSGVEVSYVGHRHDNASAAVDGFLSKADFTKLAGIAANANNYVHPATHSLDMVTETAALKVMTAAERTKLAGVETGANLYVHPATHSLDVITETAEKKILTAAERSKLAAVEANAINQASADARYLQVATGGSLNGDLSVTSNGDAKVSINADADNDGAEIGEAKLVLTQDGGIVAAEVKLSQGGDNANTLVLAPFMDYDTASPVKNYNVFVHDKKVWHEGNLLKSEFATAGHIHVNASASVDGFMSKADFSKLAGVAANANNYVHPATHSLDVITETTAKKIMTDAERTKLAGIAASANNYTHPATHPASMIVEATDKRFLLDAERTKLGNIEANANLYVHPDTHSVSILTETIDLKVMTGEERTKLAGVAVNANNYVHPPTHALSVITETDELKILTAAERTKLEGIETSANRYIHPSTHSMDMMTESATRVIMTPAERTKLGGVEANANLYVHPATHALDIITETAALKIMTAAERTKLAGVATSANNYAHPTGDGNLHVPATGTANNTKVLKAGATAGSLAWGQVAWGEVTGKPTTFAPVTATAAVLGGITVGDNLTVDANGRLSANAPYAHPAGDGNKHVPADAGTNGNKVLKATSTAGSPVWGSVAYSELTGVPATFTPATHTHSTSEVAGLDNALNARATLAGNNTFSGNNTFTNAGLSVKIQPSSAVAANTVLFQVNNSLGGSLVTMGASGAGETVAKIVINGDLEVTGTTVQKSTQDIQGDMNVTGNLNVTGDAVLGDDLSDLTRVNGDLVVKGTATLGDVDKDVTAKGDLRVEGNFIPVGKYLEVGRFPVYGIAGDPQFQTEGVGTFEEIVDHMTTFNTAGLSCLAPAAEGATRYYKVMLSYSSTGADDAVVRITQSDGTTEVFSAALPAVNGTVLNKARTWLSAPFSTVHGGDTVFQAKKNTSGALAIRYVEVIALDYFN